MYSFASNVRSYYNAINPAFLTGAVDVIVVEQPDGTLRSTPFHVRFGKYGVFNIAEKFVDITINGEKMSLKMKLGDNGVGYFVQEIDGTNDIPEYLASSPFPSSPASLATSDIAINKLDDVEPCEMKKAKKSKSDTKISSSRSNIARKPSVALSSTSLHKKTKMKLPFSSSIFSDRKNRSLPELSQSFEDDNDELYDPELPSAADGRSGSPASPHRMDMIDDGAVSDSELDRTRKLSADYHEDDNTVWEWGEFPHAIIDEKKKATKSRSYWSRIFGRSATKTKQHDSLMNEQSGSSNVADKSKKSGRNIVSPSTSDLCSPTVLPSATDLCSATVPSAIDDDDSNANPISPKAISPTTVSLDSKSSTLSSSSKSQEKLPANLTNEKPIDTGEEADDEDEDDDDNDQPIIGSRKGCANCDVPTEEEPMPPPKYIRSLRLSSNDLKSLQLRYGSNEARFSVKTSLQGTSWCSCHIYLFKYSDIIVISDVDGTITKSDFLGHIIAAIGGQWAHAGVAELFTRIKQNGYKMVYLSSRAIGQSHYTKSYLQKIAQGSKTLPDGPVLLSPTSVLMAFRKEVIERRPDEFKISCLSDLKSLFPVKYPFYAGFGNRDTDIKSYSAVDIPLERILIINKSGAVKRADGNGFLSTYSLMAMEMLDDLFPPLHLTPREMPGEYMATKCEAMSTKFTTKPKAYSPSRRTAPPDTVSMKDEITDYEKKKSKKMDDKKHTKWYRRTH